MSRVGEARRVLVHVDGALDGRVGRVGLDLDGVHIAAVVCRVVGNENAKAAAAASGESDSAALVGAAKDFLYSAIAGSETETIGKDAQREGRVAVPTWSESQNPRAAAV